jgi:hypothetical protein
VGLLFLVCLVKVAGVPFILSSRSQPGDATFAFPFLPFAMRQLGDSPRPATGS